MKAAKLPLATLGLSFLTACGDQGELEGLWEGFSVMSDGEDVTNDYIYSYTDGDCTYTYRRFMVLDDKARGGLFSESKTECGSESYSNSYGVYLNFEKSAGKWVSGIGDYSFECTAPVKNEIECGVSDEMVFRFRRGN